MKNLLKRPMPVEDGLKVDLQKADPKKFYCYIEFPHNRNNKSFVNTFQKILNCINKRIEKGYDSQTKEEYLKEHSLSEVINHLCSENYKVNDNSVTEFFSLLKNINFDPFTWIGFYILKDENSLCITDTEEESENEPPKLICNFNTNDFYIVNRNRNRVTERFETSSAMLRYYFFDTEEPESYLCNYEDYNYEDNSFIIKVGINAKTGEPVKFINAN